MSAEDRIRELELLVQSAYAMAMRNLDMPTATILAGEAALTDVVAHMSDQLDETCSAATELLDALDGDDEERVRASRQALGELMGPLPYDRDRRWKLTGRVMAGWVAVGEILLEAGVIDVGADVDGMVVGVNALRVSCQAWEQSIARFAAKQLGLERDVERLEAMLGSARSVDELGLHTACDRALRQLNDEKQELSHQLQSWKLTSDAMEASRDRMRVERDALGARVDRYRAALVLGNRMMGSMSGPTGPADEDAWQAFELALADLVNEGLLEVGDD